MELRSASLLEQLLGQYPALEELVLYRRDRWRDVNLPPDWRYEVYNWLEALVRDFEPLLNRGLREIIDRAHGRTSGTYGETKLLTCDLLDDRTYQLEREGVLLVLRGPDSGSGPLCFGRLQGTAQQLQGMVADVAEWWDAATPEECAQHQRPASVRNRAMPAVNAAAGGTTGGQSPRRWRWPHLEWRGWRPRFRF